MVIENRKGQSAMLPPLAEIPLSPSTCLALDMVLTITADPPFFSSLAAKVKKGGGRVIVIVSRPPEERANTLQELGKYGLQYDDIVFMPLIEEAVQSCPHREELGHYGSYLWNKIHIAELSGVTHFIGAEPLVRDLFRRFLPSVVAHYPRDLYPRASSTSEGKAKVKEKANTPCNGAWLYQPKNPVQPPASAPWWPVRTYFVSIYGDMEALYRAVTKLNGALYNDGLVVVPANIGLADVSRALREDGSPTKIESWTETWQWATWGG
jgi:hypothetical protein